MFKMTLTLPKVNEDWWKTSKTELTKIVEEYNRQSWQQEKDPVTETRWNPRKSSAGSWPILRKTGTMQDTTKFKSAGVMEFSAKTSVNYGGFHQFGTSRMPRRRWLGIGDSVIKPMTEVIGKNLFKGRTRITIS